MVGDERQACPDLFFPTGYNGILTKMSVWMGFIFILPEAITSHHFIEGKIWRYFIEG